MRIDRELMIKRIKVFRNGYWNSKKKINIFQKIH